MLIFFLFVLENLQHSEASKYSELLLNSNSNNLGQRSILFESESKYFLGTSKNISSSIDTEYLLLYSIPTTTDSSIFDPIYIQNINPPPWRKYYGIFSGDNEVYIYGGVSESKVFNDFWRYDIGLGVWTDISHFFTAINLPPLYEFGYTSFKAGYYNHGITYNYLMIAGGIDDQGKFIDKVWLFYFNKKIDEKIIRLDSFNSIAGCANGPLAGLKISRSNYYFYIFSGYRKQNDTENPFYQFENICFLNFAAVHNWFLPNQNFNVYQPTFKQIGLFNQHLMVDSTIYQFFGIEYIRDKAEFNTAVYSLNINDLKKGWTKHANLDIKAHSFSLVKKQNYLYFVEGDALSSYQINYPAMNSTIVQRLTSNPQKNLNLVRLGNGLYLYNSSLFKIKPQDGKRKTSVLIEKIITLNNGPIENDYLYSGEGDFLLITEYILEKTGFEYPRFRNIGTKFWLFNVKTQIWINYKTDSIIPYDINNACSILKFPFIILIGELGLRSGNIFDDYQYRIYLFNTITLSYKLYELNYDPVKIFFNCQILKTYQSLSSIIPLDVIELVVTTKKSDESKKFYRIEKLTISEKEMTQKNFFENLNDIHAPSYNYFLVDTDEIYFFDFFPRNIGSDKGWWENTNSVFARGEGRIVHYCNVSTNESSIEVLNNRVYVFSGTTNDKVTRTIIDSHDFYESNLHETSLIRSCDYGYTMVSGSCQPCEIGTYNDNKVEGVCVPCNTLLNTTSRLGSWSSSQCTNLLVYASEIEKNLIFDTLGLNRNESHVKHDQLADSSYGLATIITITLFTSLSFVMPLQLLLLKIDYFQFNSIKTKKRKYKIERLTKKNAYYNNENQNNEFWANHKRQTITEKIEIIKEKIENNLNFDKHRKLRGFFKGLVLMVTIILTSALFMGFYYCKEQTKNEIISISESEENHGKIESIVQVSIGLFPANQKLCDIDLDLRPDTGKGEANPKHHKNVESHSYFLKTDNGGACIIGLKANFTEFNGKFNAKLELLSRRFYAKNLFLYIQSYNSKLEYPSSVFEAFESSEGKSFYEKIKLNLTLNKKTFIEDYFFNSHKVSFNSIDKDSLNVSSNTTSDDYLPLGSRMIFDISIVQKDTAEVATIKHLSSPDYNLILLLFAIILIHEGLKSCAFKILNWLEESQKKIEN